MRLCVRLSWRVKRNLFLSDMIKGKSDDKVVLGVSHPHKGKSWRSVTFKMEQEDGDKVLQAAKETGRSVAGFVRYAALRYAEELAGKN